MEMTALNLSSQFLAFFPLHTSVSYAFCLKPMVLRQEPFMDCLTFKF